MNIIEKSQVQHYHRSRIERDDPKNRTHVQGWTSPEAQQVRMEAIAGLLDLEFQSLLDLGSGDGDLLRLLDDRGYSFDYIGIDQQPEFIDYARKKYEGRNGCWFYQADFTTCRLPVMDVVVACGALSYRSADPDFYHNMIAKFYQAASRRFVFNMLDNSGFESGSLIVAHDREAVLTYCRTLDPRAQLVSDYLVNDFTVCMNRR